MMEKKLENSRWVSSVEIIKNTSISRATLNNYIKMNLLPRPHVKKPEEKSIRARLIGYFPASVIDTIEQIKYLKKKGCRMDIISEKLKNTDTITSSAEVVLPPESGTFDVTGAGNILQTEPIDSVATSQKIMGHSSAHFSECSKKNHDPLRQEPPTLISYSVLLADLHDSARIFAELPTEEYFELINQIWTCVEVSSKKYHGIHRKHTEGGMFCFFVKERDNHYIINAVSCALEINESMKRINMEWKLRKGWLNELYLNIGLNEGQEYVGIIGASCSMGMIPGDTDDHVRLLLDFTQYGAIWTTKKLMNKLTLKEKAGIRYGVRRMDKNQEILVEKCFSRIIDMITQENIKNKYMDIATLAVTEILGWR